jgi:hypothetical protein
MLMSLLHYPQMRKAEVPLFSYFPSPPPGHEACQHKANFVSIRGGSWKCRLCVSSFDVSPVGPRIVVHQQPDYASTRPHYLFPLSSKPSNPRHRVTAPSRSTNPKEAFSRNEQTATLKYLYMSSGGCWSSFVYREWENI